MTAAELAERLAAALARPGPASSDFDLNPDVSLPPGRKLRPAAVLVGALADARAPRVILTMRASTLRHHPGQIAFPGGRQDPGDPTPEAAALREAAEEIGLPDGAARLIGRLPAHETVTGFTVTPVVAVLERSFTPVPEAAEVAEVFTVPFDRLADPGFYRVESRRWRGVRRHYYVAPYGPYYIWGATARILRGLAERLR